MTLAELRKKTEQELNETLKKVVSELEVNQLNILKGKEKNVKKGSQFKKQVAQIKTVLTEKRILQNA